MTSDSRLIQLIDNSLLLSDVKKRLLKKQLPFYSEKDQVALLHYLSSEVNAVGDSLNKIPDEELSSSNVIGLQTALAQAKKNLNKDEEAFDQLIEEAAVENLLNKL